jgi:hypothetical protein
MQFAARSSRTAAPCVLRAAASAPRRAAAVCAPPAARRATGRGLRMVRAEATETEEAMTSSSRGDDSIGMGLMEDVMKSAAGGAAVPGWVPAIPELEAALKVLASDSVVISDKLLVEKYGEALFAATGFTKRAEMINGRLAVRACACACA